MLYHAIFLLPFLFHVSLLATSRDADIPRILDVKDFQKLLKLRTNVLVVVSKTASDVPRDFLTILDEVEKEMKGVADVVLVDCSESKKLCKKFKFEPYKMEVKHFFNGRFHKDYDRALRTKSIITFLKSPQEEAPWSEDMGTKDVIHIDEAKDLMTVFKRESKRQILMLFYTPWCHHCKQMKPEFASAATMLKKDFAFVGIDCQKAENYPLQQGFNVSGYPTILLMSGGNLVGRYIGGPNRSELIEWLTHPELQLINPEPKTPPADEPWTAEHVDMLTTDNFDSFITTNPSVLVMFYAPWCGHCKRLKPEYEEAAKTVVGRLAAVDATKETALARKYKISGYPSLKYFADGEFKFDVHFRSKDEIISFMADPKEPPAAQEQNGGWEHDPEMADMVSGKTVIEFLDDDTFHSTMKKKKHGLVIFYAPWCGHCKATKPNFSAAAKSFVNNPKVSFVAVDCTKSLTVCKEHDIRGFPTIVYFTYGKNPLPYEGQRESDAFIKFMNSQIDFYKKSEL